jgi:pantoate--beta-alanine ligase
MPDRAYFGRKDAQQAVIIRRMVADLNIPVEVKVMPIVREPDGLAMSSRNVYLNPQERKDAVVLFKALQQAKNMISQGKRNAHAVKKAMHALILSKKTASIDYIAIVDADTLTPLDKIKGKCLIALAVRIGRTRLIDNIVVN